GVARLVDSLLHQCPRLHVLATTREELGIIGEVVWLVPPLSLPATDEDLAIRNLAQHDAIRLFVERATDAWQAFALTEDNAAAVTYLCRQLDGMPMAIELAAARVRLLRVEQIVARLENRFQLLAGGNHTAPPRHQTLKALIDWSYGLLSPVDQRLLRRLSVFAHGFQLEAVEAICDEESEGNTLDSLTHLVTKSLVVSNRASGKTARFELHETIRQYAWLELVQTDESDRILERHGAYFVQLAEELHPQLYCDSQLTSPEWWLAEYGNLRAVLNRVFADKVLSLEAGLCLAARLTDFWLMEGPKSEGRYWLEKATARMSGVAPAIRAALYYNLGKLWIGRKGESLAKKSLQLFLRVEDNIGAAWALNLLGHLVKDNDQDFARSSALFTKSIEMASDQDTENKLLLANLAGLSLVNIQIGQYEPAREYVERGLVLARAANDGQQIATLLRFRGAVARMQKDYELATSSFLEALPLAREVHAKNLVIASLNGLGEVLRDQRKFAEAIPYYTEGLAVFREWDPTRSGTMLANLGHAVVDNGEPERATAILRESLSIVEEDPRPGEVAWSLWGFSKVSLSKGQLERAARLYGAAEGLLTSSGSTTDPLDRADAEHNKSRLRIELGEEAFSTAWAEGEQLSLEAAVAYAVEEQA
ncbi:MAG TPA: tetratricopeptide repeat protein, partial [Promineifilum sp.]